MWGIRKTAKTGGDLEARLRSARPEAPDHLVKAVVTSVAHRERPRVWSRLAFAAAFTTLLLGTFASIGGVSYTATSASSAYKTVKSLTGAKPIRVHSAAAEQYKPSQPNEGAAPSQTSQSAGAGAVEAESGTLPFTGISLLATAILGLGLIILGLALRRRERSNI